jgi:hypothetical protein
MSEHATHRERDDLPENEWLSRRMAQLSKEDLEANVASSSSPVLRDAAKAELDRRGYAPDPGPAPEGDLEPTVLRFRSNMAGFINALGGAPAR